MLAFLCKSRQFLLVCKVSKPYMEPRSPQTLLPVLTSFHKGLNGRSQANSSGVSKAERGRGWMTLCIKIVYSEPRGTESRNGSSTLAESSRVFLGDVMVESD